MEEKLLGQQKPYDPRDIRKSEETELVVWNSESVHLAEIGLKEGYKLKANPFLPRQQDVNLRRSNLPFQYTEDELFIINKCMNDKIFMINNFVSLKDADAGWKRIKLRDYQEKLLNKYSQEK